MATKKLDTNSGTFTITVGEHEHTITYGPTKKTGLTVIDIDGKRLGNFRTYPNQHRFGLDGAAQFFPVTMTKAEVARTVATKALEAREAVARNKAEAKAAAKAAAAKAKAAEAAEAAKATGKAAGK